MAGASGGGGIVSGSVEVMMRLRDLPEGVRCVLGDVAEEKWGEAAEKEVEFLEVGTVSRAHAPPDQACATRSRMPLGKVAACRGSRKHRESSGQINLKLRPDPSNLRVGKTCAYSPGLDSVHLVIPNP